MAKTRGRAKRQGGRKQEGIHTNLKQGKTECFEPGAVSNKEKWRC